MLDSKSSTLSRLGQVQGQGRASLPSGVCPSLLGHWINWASSFLLLLLGMRILVMLLLDTLPMLGNVLLLCFFVFFIFGIIGVQLWAGLLRQRCYIPKENLDLIIQSRYYV